MSVRTRKQSSTRSVRAVCHVTGPGRLSASMSWRAGSPQGRHLERDRTTAAPGQPSWRTSVPRSSRGGAGGSGDPGGLVGAGIEENRAPVVTSPDRANLAALQAVDVDAVPVDVAPGGGDA